MVDAKAAHRVVEILRVIDRTVVAGQHEDEIHGRAGRDRAGGRANVGTLT
jgi:hypothetical protein